jgi:adenylate cyclase, class 2
MAAHRRSGTGSFHHCLDVYSVSMPKTVHRQEIEIKLRVLDVAAILARLQRLGAREISPRTHESNTLYDTPRQHLRRRGQLIRIRIVQPASNFGRKRPHENPPVVLTFKGPALVSDDASNAGGRVKMLHRFKVKEEAEVTLLGAKEIDRILRALGLRPAFRYEKFRTTFLLPGLRSLKIELDETPVGIYLELEGTIGAINRAARLLGYTRKDYRKESYGSLYLAACRRRGRKPGNMLFPPTKKLRKRALFP